MTTSSAVLVLTVNKKTAATMAPRVAPTRRCSAARADWAKLGFIAAMVARGIQSAFGTFRPNAIPTARVTATARMTPKRMTCLLSGTGVTSPGIRSAKGWVGAVRPRASQITVT